MKILVVDDDALSAEMSAAVLESLGHQVAIAGDALAALEQLADQADIALVVSDLHMPLMDGVAATRAIRALPDAAHATVPIVALTADATPETRERCLVAGMNDFLTKPVAIEALRSVIERNVLRGDQD